MRVKTMYYDFLESPLGQIAIVADEKGLRHIDFQQGDKPLTIKPQWQRSPSLLRPFTDQLSAYFAGKLKHFDLPLAPEGTRFQQQVWQALCQVPYGELVSYRDIANRIGNSKAVRAVGAANGRNPVSIVIPCHRIVGSNGKLTGYAAGLSIKRQLIAFEQHHNPLVLN